MPVLDLTTIFAVLFGLSEVIALIPGVKSNSVFQLIFNTLKSLAGKVSGPSA